MVKACSLEHDLTVLPQGEDTEIGEKGINLSGLSVIHDIYRIFISICSRRSEGIKKMSYAPVYAGLLKISKARVSLARAAYSQFDIVILDDPLSAVDAYVGKYIMDHCLLEGPLANRTRILVTHSLHVLDKVDYIYVMENGAIIEQGTYSVRIGCINGKTFFYSQISESRVGWPCIFTFDGRVRKPVAEG